MDNTFTDAVLASNLDSMQKLVLLGMIAYMDNRTHRTWISAPSLAREIGLSEKSRSTIQLRWRELEQWGVITKVGQHPLNPMSSQWTNIWEINLKRLKELARSADLRPGSYELPTRISSEQLGSSEQRNLYTAHVSQAGLRLSPPVGVEGVPPKGECLTERYGTVPFRTTESASQKDQNPDQHQQQHQTLSDSDMSDLLELWIEVLGLPVSSEIPYAEREALRAFNKCPAATLAVDMMWAFKASDYWIESNKAKAWPLGLTLMNFLGAWSTIARQFGDWRNNVRQNFLEDWPTVKDVIYHLAPHRNPNRKTTKAFEVEDECQPVTVSKEYSFDDEDDEPSEPVTVSEAFEIDEDVDNDN